MEQYEKRLKLLGAQATKLLDRHGAESTWRRFLPPGRESVAPAASLWA